MLWLAWNSWIMIGSPSLTIFFGASSPPSPFFLLPLFLSLTVCSPLPPALSDFYFQTAISSSDTGDIAPKYQMVSENRVVNLNCLPVLTKMCLLETWGESLNHTFHHRSSCEGLFYVIILFDLKTKY